MKACPRCGGEIYSESVHLSKLIAGTDVRMSGLTAERCSGCDELWLPPSLLRNSDTHGWRIVQGTR